MTHFRIVELYGAEAPQRRHSTHEVRFHSYGQLPSRPQADSGAEDGIRTHDPHLGRAAVSVSMVGVTPL